MPNRTPRTSDPRMPGGLSIVCGSPRPKVANGAIRAIGPRHHNDVTYGEPPPTAWVRAPPDLFEPQPPSGPSDRRSAPVCTMLVSPCTAPGRSTVPSCARSRAYRSMHTDASPEKGPAGHQDAFPMRSSARRDASSLLRVVGAAERRTSPAIHATDCDWYLRCVASGVGLEAAQLAAARTTSWQTCSRQPLPIEARWHCRFVDFEALGTRHRLWFVTRGCAGLCRGLQWTGGERRRRCYQLC